MYLTDYHSHSELSPDSSTPLMEAAQAAIAMGISELCITDHFDLLTGDGLPRYASELDWTERVAQYKAVKSALAGKLTLKLGIEFGSGHRDPAEAEAALRCPELDFVIGSLHNSSPRHGGIDLYYVKYTAPEICYALLDDYFESMADLVERDCFDVLGHIIYPVRYMCCRDGQGVDIYRYLDQMRAILKVAAQRGKGIELNTWCGKTLEDWRPLLKAYRECGGELITVGADGHVPGNIGRGVREAYQLLKDEGFRYVTTYEKRRPIQIKL